VITACRAAVGMGFKSPYPFSYPQKNMWESPQNIHRTTGKDVGELKIIKKAM